MSEPTLSRPRMPDGYGVPRDVGGALPWRDVVARLEASLYYWMGTASPDAAPHARPIWGAWVDNRWYWDGAPTTRWARDIAANPRMSMHLESGEQAVIVEGTNGRVTQMDADVFKRIGDQYEAKYTSYRPERAEDMYVLTPRVAYAWTKFPGDVTKYTW